MQRRIKDVLQGQRYRKLGAGGGLWEVVAIGTDASGATHARMKSINEPTTFRTFAIGVLADPRTFHAIEER